MFGQLAIFSHIRICGIGLFRLSSVCFLWKQVIHNYKEEVLVSYSIVSSAQNCSYLLFVPFIFISAFYLKIAPWNARIFSTRDEIKRSILARKSFSFALFKVEILPPDAILLPGASRHSENNRKAEKKIWNFWHPYRLLVFCRKKKCWAKKMEDSEGLPRALRGTRTDTKPDDFFYYHQKLSYRLRMTRL